jgi:hypothetical protein
MYIPRGASSSFTVAAIAYDFVGCAFEKRRLRSRNGSWVATTTCGARTRPASVSTVHGVPLWT